MARFMSISTYPLLMLASGLAIAIALSMLVRILVARRLNGAEPLAAPLDEADPVLELEQLSFDQVPRADAPQASAIEFGVRPDRLVIDELRSRLEFTMALFNTTQATLLGIHVTSDLLILDDSAPQRGRPTSPTMRQDALARLDPGEKLLLPGDWDLPEGLLAALSDTASGGLYLLARVRITGGNIAAQSKYFIFGHLRENGQLLRLANEEESFTSLGVTETGTS